MHVFAFFTHFGDPGNVNAGSLSRCHNRTLECKRAIVNGTTNICCSQVKTSTVLIKKIVLECCQYKLLLNLGDVDINKTNVRFTDQYYTEFSMEVSYSVHIMTTSGEEGTEPMFKSLDKTGK